MFKEKCAGAKFKINDVDHLPPHCHVWWGDGKTCTVNLLTLEPREKGVELPGPVRDCLKKFQAAMLEAWDDVTIMGEDQR